MPRRSAARVTLRIFLALAAVHLVWQLTDQSAYARVSQWFLMPVLAVFLLVRTRGVERTRLVRLTLVALGFSWLGDTAPSLVEGDTAFLVMVGFFLVAQVVYIVAFWPHRDQSVLRQRRALLLPYAVAIVALVLACAPHAGTLLVPVLAYGLLLGAMAVLATGLNSLVWAGGALFLVSDGLIAMNAFAPWWDLPGQGFWVMLTYIAAQLLIVLGVLRTHDPIDRVPGSTVLGTQRR
ncbi:lysoplasmalogenase [Ornithinimicrobium faecis]|uniref:Lysoplasmalogenase n=1 Tax=Ornithinimicrobium faecis TaxID=2934158 RepID=A0ABY4YWT2_9MICO|nr:lysoplasmalogenase [Ornithinimicrobium sp. HY1793]USQ80989.1 lysoplasmalogenase [Ornithinimicrobium sp. HY1793]